MIYNIPPGLPSFMLLQPISVTLLTGLNPIHTGTSSSLWDTPSSCLPQALRTCGLLCPKSSCPRTCGPEDWLPPHPGNVTSPEGASRTLTSPRPQKPHSSVTPLRSIQSTCHELNCFVCSFTCMLTVCRPCPFSRTVPIGGKVLLRLVQLCKPSVCRVYHTVGVQRIVTEGRGGNKDLGSGFSSELAKRPPPTPRAHLLSFGVGPPISLHPSAARPPSRRRDTRDTRLRRPVVRAATVGPQPRRAGTRGRAGPLTSSSGLRTPNCTRLMVRSGHALSPEGGPPPCIAEAGALRRRKPHYKNPAPPPPRCSDPVGAATGKDLPELGGKSRRRERWGREGGGEVKKERKELSSPFPEIFRLPKRKKKKGGEGKGFGGGGRRKRVTNK